MIRFRYVFLLFFSSQWISSSSSIPFPTAAGPPLVLGIDGGTESLRACCFDARTGHVVGAPCAVPYPTRHPTAGWAEQDPADWWRACVAAVRGAVASVPNHDIGNTIVALAIDTTCCSVVALDDRMEPLRPSLLWMDQRSAPQTRRLLELARGDSALLVNQNGHGPVSAEWLIPKALWLKENEPLIWEKASTICEYQDYMNFQLTGILCASTCNAVTRWHWDGSSDPPRQPLSLYDKLGLNDLARKLPQQCIPMGQRIGALTPAAAAQLGLPADLPVIQGGPDAFVGMIGLGCIQPGQLCLITGSSHLHCVVTAQPTTARGIWGAYANVPLPGIHFAEGGQSSTGSILRWAKSLFGSDESSALNYKVLDQEAEAIPPGADGLVALETFQGSRTPVTDPLARGALIGLTLSHRRGHIWRALMEAVCYGTRACTEGLAAAGHACDEIILAGGVTRSDIWLQMHADISGKVVTVCENSDAPLLGCAILASAGVGLHPSVADAVAAMVRVQKKIAPSAAVSAKYDEIYQNVYKKVADAVQPVSHAIHNLRGGHHEEGTEVSESGTHMLHKEWPIISPSLLACDWSNMEKEVHRCLTAGLHRFHVDIFDGVYLESPKAFTFGPQMVTAIRKSIDSFDLEAAPVESPSLDLHMCVVRPDRFVDVMAQAGADRFIFQMEAMENLTTASTLASHIAQVGMKCGISINPATSVDELYPLLQSKLIDCVDILSVEPGFGGQQFQSIAISKVEALKKWREEHLDVNFEIMVDGGINLTTYLDAVNAGADVLVTGSHLFQHSGNHLKESIEALRKQQHQ